MALSRPKRVLAFLVSECTERNRSRIATSCRHSCCNIAIALIDRGFRRTNGAKLVRTPGFAN
jgi:stage V sporulation protein SpoVS